MEEILHHLTDSSSHFYLQVFYIPGGWPDFRAMNSMTLLENTERKRTNTSKNWFFSHAKSA